MTTSFEAIAIGVPTIARMPRRFPSPSFADVGEKKMVRWRLDSGFVKAARSRRESDTGAVCRRMPGGGHAIFCRDGLDVCARRGHGVHGAGERTISFSFVAASSPMTLPVLSMWTSRRRRRAKLLRLVRASFGERSRVEFSVTARLFVVIQLRFGLKPGERRLT